MQPKSFIAPAAALTALLACAAPAQAAGPLLGHYGPTETGDTLWKVARSVRGDSGASVQRIFHRLVRDNPDAFVDGNPNRLRLGVLLEVRGPMFMARRGWTDESIAAPALVATTSTPIAPAPRSTSPSSNTMAASASHDDHASMASPNSMAASSGHDDMGSSSGHDDMGSSSGNDEDESHSMAASSSKQDSMASSSSMEASSTAPGKN